MHRENGHRGQWSEDRGEGTLLTYRKLPFQPRQGISPTPSIVPSFSQMCPPTDRSEDTVGRRGNYERVAVYRRVVEDESMGGGEEEKKGEAAEEISTIVEEEGGKGGEKRRESTAGGGGGGGAAGGASSVDSRRDSGCLF